MSVASLGILGKDSNIEKSVHPGSGQEYFRRLWWRKTLGGDYAKLRNLCFIQFAPGVGRK